MEYQQKFLLKLYVRATSTDLTCLTTVKRSVANDHIFTNTTLLHCTRVVQEVLRVGTSCVCVQLRIRI